MRLGLLAPLIAALAVQAGAAAGDHARGPNDCPPFAAAVCRGQRTSDGLPCGQASQHNLAYALRAGHYDYDWMSGLLYNEHMAGENIDEWEWLEAPDPEDVDAWCLEDCRYVRRDPKRKKEPCADPPARVASPGYRPPWPRMIRCFMGDDYSGGIDYIGSFPMCGAPPGITKPGKFPPIRLVRRAIRGKAGPAPMTEEELRECTGGNPKCVCVKGNAGFSRFESAARAAVQRAFQGAATKPAGMSDAEATAKICEAYMASPTLGPGSVCRAQKDEIVIETPGGQHPAVSIDVVTSEGGLWSKAIAACESGVH